MRSSNFSPSPTRVLIVDNHELVRRGLAALVSAETDMVSCGEVAGSEAALDAVRRLQPDVVLIDVSLARGAGLELIQRIREYDARIRIVALAITEQPELVERISSAGAAAIILRTNLAVRVLEAIRRVQAGELADERSSAMRLGTPAARSDGNLEPVEREIIGLIGDGASTRAIAVRLGLSLAMVAAFRRRIRRKLSFPTATQLVQFCVRWVEQSRSALGRERAFGRGDSVMSPASDHETSIGSGGRMPGLHPSVLPRADHGRH